MKTLTTMIAPIAETNDRTRAGQCASDPAYFDGCRFKVYAVHTRFDAVQWFAIDQRKLLLPDDPAVIAQCPTFAECLSRIEVQS